MPTDATSARPEALTQNRPAITTEASQQQISLLDLLIALGERKAFILLCTLATAGLAILLALVLPSTFTATTSLLTPQQSSSMANILAAQLGNLSAMSSIAGGSLGLKNPNDIFVAMLKSRTVENAMVRRFDLQREYGKRYLSDARRSFERHASVDGDTKDGLIHISVRDHDRKRAAELANGYVEQFRDLSEHLAISEAAQRRLFFEKQLGQAKDNLAGAEEALKQTEQKTGLIQLDSQARALIESAASLRAQVVAKEVQLQSLRTFATSENAQLIQTQQELDSLRAQLAKLGGSENAPDEALLVPKGQVPQASLEYIRKLRDVKYYETIFEILARQYEMAKLDEAREGALVQVVDPAVPPDKKSFPSFTLFLCLGASAGLLFGSLIAVAQHLLARACEDPEFSVRFAKLRTTWRRSVAGTHEARGNNLCNPSKTPIT